MLTVYFNCLIDTETHPQIANISTKKEMMEIAATLTTNKIVAIDWQANDYLVFAEVIEVDETSEENREYSIEAVINSLSPKVSDAEYSSHTKTRKR